MLQIIDINVQYGTHKVLQNFNVTLKKGAKLAIYGKNGTGKSTLIKCINGIIPHDSTATLTGTILWETNDIIPLPINERSQYISSTFQSADNTLFMSSVKSEFAFGMENMGYDVDTMQKNIAEVGAALKIEDLLDKNPTKLSGGLKAIVHIASALVLKKPLLLLDEPFSNLSDSKSDLLSSYLQSLSDTTVLVVSHNPITAQFCSNSLTLEGEK